MDPLGRQPGAPVGQHGRQVEGAAEPRAAALDLVEEAPEGPLAALLDALLPGRGQRPAEVARGVDDVHLAALRSRIALAITSGTAGARISWLTIEVPDGAAHAAQQHVPHAVGVARLAAPVLTQQVEGGAEVEEPGVTSRDRVGK